MISRTFLSTGRTAAGRTVSMIKTLEDTVPSMPGGSTPLQDIPRLYRKRPTGIPDNYTCGACRSFLAGKCFKQNMEKVRPDDGCISFHAKKRT